MEKKVLISVAILLAAIVLSAVILMLLHDENSLLVEGVLIKADSDPMQELASFREKQVFLISPKMIRPSNQLDLEMSNAMELFIQVLEGNKRDTIQVIRVFDQEGLSLCGTNFGDEKRAETLDKDACLQYLSPENGAIVLIEFPDSSLANPVLEISENKLVVRPKTEQDIDNTAFLALRLMFDNSEAILNQSNMIVKALNN